MRTHTRIILSFGVPRCCWQRQRMQTVGATRWRVAGDPAPRQMRKMRLRNHAAVLRSQRTSRS